MADKDSWKNTFAEAVKLHHRGVDGDKTAVRQAHSMLERIRDQTDDNLVKAYYGSVMTLLGRDAVDPMERVQKALRGVKLLNEAVDHDPDNVEIRLLRGYVCNRLPKIYFHRTAIAVEDFNYVLSIYDRKRMLSKESYWKILYELGEAYKKLGKNEEAKSVWGKLKSQTDNYDALLKKEGLH